MGSPKFCGNSFSHRRAHNIEYMVLALPGDFEAAHADVYKPPYPFCRRDFAGFWGARPKFRSPVNLHRYG